MSARRRAPLRPLEKPTRSSLTRFARRSRAASCPAAPLGPSRYWCATASPAPIAAAEVAAELIKSDKVDLMLVAGTPDTVNPVADQCEINQVPCVSTDAPWQAYFFGRGGNPAKGFDWTYHFFWGADAHSAGHVPRCSAWCRPIRSWACCVGNDTEGNALLRSRERDARRFSKRGALRSSIRGDSN